MTMMEVIKAMPWVTITLAATVILIYFANDQLLDIRNVALCPKRVFQNWSTTRVIFSALLHGNGLHLLHNALSLLWKGRKLESFLGRWGFMRTCFDLLLLSHSLTLCLSWGIYHYHDYTPFNMEPFKDAYQECFIGLNPMLFALKIVLSFISPDKVLIFGIQVPSKLIAALELTTAHMVVPKFAFVGHLSGLLAGTLYMYFPFIIQAIRNLIRAVRREPASAAAPTTAAEFSPKTRRSKTEKKKHN